MGMLYLQYTQVLVRMDFSINKDAVHTLQTMAWKDFWEFKDLCSESKKYI